MGELRENAQESFALVREKPVLCGLRKVFVCSCVTLEMGLTVCPGRPLTCCVAQASAEPSILLSQPLERWDYRHELSRPAQQVPIFNLLKSVSR